MEDPLAVELLKGRLTKGMKVAAVVREQVNEKGEKEQVLEFEPAEVSLPA